MAEIFTEENSIILAAAQKMVALGATIGDRQADGKESVDEYEQGMKILTLLTAYKDHSFTNPQLEAILYDLRNLSEENNFPTISPVVGQEIVYLVEQESGSGTGTISFESNGSGLTDRDTLNFYNGLSASDGGTKINAGLGGPLSLNTIITLGSFNLTFAGGGTGKLGIDLGSDVTGDMLYRDASGDLARLGVTNDQLVGGVSGVPAYVSISAPLTLSAGTLSITQATTSTNGYLSSADWNTFNSKADPLGFTPINKAGDTGISGNLSFNTGTGIDSPGVLSIGPNATRTNLYGTELFVQDKLMTLNALGGVASGGGTGFEINENSVINGWFKTTTARTGYSIKGPANTAETNFIFSSTVSRDITFPDQAGTVVLTSGATMTGYLTLHADPSSALHPATKQYVDNLLDGLKWKQSVVVATTANITLSGEQTIDGVLTSASRILVKDQTDQTENGIYVTAAGAWSRSSDANTATELEAATVHVQQGTTNGDIDFVQITDNITLGVSNIVWTDKSTGGITNSAASNELMKSDGTNSVASGLFTTTNGDITFGTGLTGASRALTASGTATDVGFQFNVKGAGQYNFQGKMVVGASTGVTGVQNFTIVHQASTNAVHSPLLLRVTKGSSFASGIGTGIEFETETSAANWEIGGRIASVSTDITGGSEDFDFVFYQMAGGSAAVESLRLSSAGTMTIGSGLGGVGRQLVAGGSGANIQLTLQSKGSSTILNIVGSGANSPVYVVRDENSTSVMSYETANGLLEIALASDLSGRFTAGEGTPTINNSGNLFLVTQQAYQTSGNGSSGNIFLDLGIKRAAGSGTVGNMGFFTQTADFGGGEKVAHWHNATTVPTTNPTDGVLPYAEGGVWKYRDSSGNVITI